MTRPTRRAAPVTSATGRGSWSIRATLPSGPRMSYKVHRGRRRGLLRTPRSPPGPVIRMALPQPHPDEREHSARLCALIRDEIRAQGPIDFARFMDLALYAPGLGYYSAGKAKFGPAGDFVTSPELGPLYARAIARAVAPILRETGGDFVELGAGSGAFAVDLLHALAALDALPGAYRIVETSADLRERQRARIEASAPEHAARVEHLDAPPSAAWRGVLFANEVVDALPVRRFVARRDGGIAALGVTCDEEGG